MAGWFLAWRRKRAVKAFLRSHEDPYPCGSTLQHDPIRAEMLLRLLPEGHTTSTAMRLISPQEASRLQISIALLSGL
jgi:hypothetical protein